MIVVDSSIWIDFLRRRPTRQVIFLREADPDQVVMADLVLFEVLKGTRDEAHALRVAKTLEIFASAQIGGEQAAHHAARHFRALRARGITTRRQIDLLIGSFCIEHEHELLHADRDFWAMAAHLKLRQAAASLPPH
jgi:predicted nucleic acid-binding protein